MSLTGVSSFASPGPVNSPTFYSERKSDATQLQQALQNGDLAGAQSAYSSLASLQSSTGTGPFPNNKVLSGDFAALGDALKAGDLAGAQQVGLKLRQDIKTAIQNQGQNAIPPNALSSVQPEIIINLSGSNSGSSTAPSTGSTAAASAPSATSPTASTAANSSPANSALPELVLNLGGGSGSPSQIDLNFGSAAAGSQIEINLGTGSNGPAETIGINIVA